MKFHNILIATAVLVAACAGLSACQEEEPDTFSASSNGVYFDDEKNNQLTVDLNFATKIIKPINTLSFDVDVKLLGLLSAAERRVQIVGEPVADCPSPEIDALPKEVVFAPYESVKTVTFTVARPAQEDVKYALSLRLQPISGDLGDGVEGKDVFTVYVSTIYQKPESWDESPISTFFGQWTKEKHIYLAKCFGKDTYYNTNTISELDLIWAYPQILNDLRLHHEIDVEVPYRYNENAQYNQEPDFWTELHNEYITDFSKNPWYAGNTFAHIAEAKGLTTKTDSLWFSAKEEQTLEQRVKEINKDAVEIMQDVYDSIFATMHGDSYFSTANYKMKYDVPILKGIDYKFRQPKCWSDDGAYAQATKPLVEKYYGSYSEGKLDFMVNTLLELAPEAAKLYYIFPVSCAYNQEEKKFLPRYDNDHPEGKGEEIMLELNEIFRGADLDNRYNFPTITE